MTHHVKRLANGLSGLFAFLLVFSATAVSPAWSASQQTADSHWAAVKPEELALKDNPDRPGSAAMILYRQEDVDDIKSTADFYYRVKVFSQEGEKYGTVEIPYVERLDTVEDVRARTIEADGTVVEFSGEILDKTLLKYRKFRYQAKVLVVSDVRPGSIIEYAYRVQWRGSKKPDFLKHPLAYEFTHPIVLSCGEWRVQEDLFTRRARFTMNPYKTTRVDWTAFGLPPGKTPQAVADGSFELELENIAGLDAEENMPPEDVLRAKVAFFYSFGYFSAESLWRDQAQARSEEFERYLGSSKQVQPAVDSVVSGNEPALDKLRKLYARAQQVRNLSYEPERTAQEEANEALKTNKNVADVLKNGYGTGLQVNLLFIALARAAGFNAHLLLVADRERTFFRENLFDWDQLNANVVEVRLNDLDAPLYLDPATKFCPFGSLPWGETGTRGIRLDPNNGGIVEIPPPHSGDARITRTADLRLDATGALQGKLHVRFEGQEALERRLEALDEDETTRHKNLEDEVKSWLPASASVKVTAARAWDDSGQPLEADFDVDFPEFGSKSGQRLLIPVGVFQSGQNRPFAQADRAYPVYFRYPWQESDDVTVTLPAGYKVQASPDSQQTTPFGHYKIACQQNDGTVRIHREFTIEEFTYSADRYPLLRAYYFAAGTSDHHQAVLGPTVSAQAASRQ